MIEVLKLVMIMLMKKGSCSDNLTYSDGVLDMYNEAKKLLEGKDEKE